MSRSIPDAEAHWNLRWRELRAHEVDASPGQPKWFGTYPYSYMNAFAHVGHAFTMTRVDFFARYQRMLGKKALFPFAFHVTGTPIVAAANRVKEGEAKQIQILRMQGFSDEEIPRFADPAHWVRFFPKEWRKDVERLGLLTDWRREFHTTDLNPHYDAFIRWQFGKLREGGYVAKGRHPVMWCPKDEAPVADHDRYEGEGETPQEWTLYLSALDGGESLVGGPAFLVAATLRPDTVFGQTNVWIDADAEYLAVKRGSDWWILNEKSAKDLAYQFSDLDVAHAKRLRGADLVGRRVRAAGTDERVPVLPASFIRHEKGTGVVTSVPSDSPQDLLSLRALQDGSMPASPEVRALAQAIRIVPVIRTEKYGTESAAKAVAEAGARDHRDAAGIAAATEKAYQAGFYEGVMLENAREFAGKRVSDVKSDITEWLAQRKEAVIGYWPTGPVVCRCLTPSVVKIVENQWFENYGDKAWKAKTQQALDTMRLYPEGARKQFNHVVGWLRAWACAREGGIGTKLPWDPKWIIESLSDSTIYMAYYTIAHLVEQGSVTGGAEGARTGVDARDLTDAFFDHVLLGKGTPESAARGTVTAEIARKARAEFAYWYPMDFRNSGKDLVQNHLTFMLFNHVAIWPDSPEMWPRGIGVNGWVNVDGEKMSKSRGNFILLRDALGDYGATATRLALANAGEGLDDANFDREFALSVGKRVVAWHEYAIDAAAGRKETRAAREGVDDWMTSVIERQIAETRSAMEETMFRSALKAGFFDLQREWSWYLKRTGGVPNADVLREMVDTQNKLLTPFAPHLAEEIHAALGLPGLAIDAPYPAHRAHRLSPVADAREAFVRATLDDLREILKVTRIDPKEIVLYTTPAWKRAAHARALAMARDGPLNPGALIKDLMAMPDVKPFAKDVPKFAGDLAKQLANVSKADLEARAGAGFDERAALAEAASFLSREMNGATVSVHAADEPALRDPAGKSKFAAPGRAAIYVA